MRIHSCPPGYKLRRTDGEPLLDDCEGCENGYYLLNSSTWLGKNATLPTCKSCPSDKAVCSGASVEALPGFWRLQFQYADGHEYLNNTGCGLRWVEGDVCMYPDGSAPNPLWFCMASSALSIYLSVCRSAFEDLQLLFASLLLPLHDSFSSFHFSESFVELCRVYYWQTNEE
jgi:hypothetical protein